MKKADLHCHSIFSEHPSEWFLQRLGAKESYTDPLFVYEEAKKQGMDYVCITDHNKIDGALQLKELHPKEVIVGVESTTYFPEDMCKIHVLIYGISSRQFEDINYHRKDIFDLRNYLKEQDIVHSVAHASYSVNGKLTVSHLEKLLLLFDHFETVNGGRNRKSNLGWKYILDNLNETVIQDIYHKHRIEPFSQKPWHKGYTGGSDDHGGLFLGQSYTMAKAKDIDEFLHAIRHKESNGVGRYNDYHSLAFTVYKIAYDFSKQQQSNKKQSGVFGIMTEYLFDNRSMDFKNKIKMKTMKNIANLQGDELKLCLSELIETLQNSSDIQQDLKLDRVYTHLSDIADAFFRTLLNSLEEDLKDLNFLKLIRNVSVSLPGIFLLIPFFSSLKHMHQSHSVTANFRQMHQLNHEDRKRRTLWFSDTINDLNGVSVTLKQMGAIAHEKGRELKLVVSLHKSELGDDLPENLLNLPYMHAFKLPYYEYYKLKTPSILKSLKLINDFEPDQIIISTPGPVGLLGLLAAKLIGIPTIGIYHTDFSGEALHIIKDESASKIVLEYERWFFNQMNEIRTPTREYMHILQDRDIHVGDMKLLRRGMDLDAFSPMQNRKAFLDKYPKLQDGITLLYAGRVSRDKSLDLLAEIYKTLVGVVPKLNLIIAGEGPYLPELQNELHDFERVLFTGVIPRTQLPPLYNAADFFIFPSVTDTFGMVILESQACGLPVLVSGTGGPKELVSHGENGYVVENQELGSWVNQILAAIETLLHNPKTYSELRTNARNATVHCADWHSILDDLLGSDLTT